MRQALDRLYFASGVLAAVFMVLIAAIVLGQIAGRFLGFLIPSAAQITGFCVAASSFLALTPTLQYGAHIRVSLVLDKLPKRVRHGFEIWCLAASVILCGYFTVALVKLFLGSFRFGSVSQGLLAIPLWIPQIGMALGMVIFTIALLDNLFLVAIRGKDAAYREGESLGTAEERL